MRNTFTKISLFILIGLIISACNSVKRVPSNKKLLTKNEIMVNDKKVKGENYTNLLYQKHNSSIFGYRIKLNLYNLAKLNHDSIYKAKFVNNPKKYERKSKWLSAKQVNRLGNSFWYAGIHEFLKNNGEAPVIIETKSSEKSINRLKSYYFNKGYFNVKARYEVDSIAPKKAKIKYFVTTGNAFFNDTIKTEILSPILDSLYKTNQSNSLIKSGKQYLSADFENERNRITTHFRNSGVFYFQPNYINFDIDTLNSNFKANIDVKINNYSYRKGDSTKTAPFKIYKISQVNIFTDYKPTQNLLNKTDSIKTTYNKFNLYSPTKLKYRPKAITDAIFVIEGSTYSDIRTNLTTRYINNLKIFNYPTIQYNVDTKDTINHNLIANIYLTPKNKYSSRYSVDFSHSNIQDFGISGNVSLAIRNVFNGAEVFEIAARGNIGSSKDLANPNNRFFNVSEYGLDFKLNFPRTLMFFNTKKIIPKTMIPSTALSIGVSKQNNIGLDKENFTGAMSYNWTPKKNTSVRYDLFNIQYVKNINTKNYFNVYSSSYETLNNLAKNENYNVNPGYFDTEGNLNIENGGADAFIFDVLNPNPTVLTTPTDKKTINSINERKIRLTENNLVLASNYTFTKSTKSDIADEKYYSIKSKLESAGSVLGLIAKASNEPKNENGKRSLLGLEYSQYLKGELEYIKHWDLKQKKILAFKSFVGIAVPFGNSNSIPFSRSYFAGGTNDNRAWQAYSLGPGRSTAFNDFNEANLKIILSSEFRFNFFGQFNGALFIDAGNIWNVFDNVEDEKAIFKGFNSLTDIAIGSGFGFRYDFNFFVVRLDFGFKTYNPSDVSNKKWFKDYNFGNSVVNIGINYPF